MITLENDIIDRNRWDYSYLLKDHIGSTHTIVNKNGQIQTNMSFNAWGQRRKQQYISGTASLDDYPISTTWALLQQDIEEHTNRGFTGHEHFDQVGIIHMNGRIYDPTIGRFLQADPVIQDPYNTQSLNRYSYVMNNPLSYTDPSGYARLRKGWWRMPVAIAISVYTAGAASGLMGASSAFSAAGAATSGSVFTSIASVLQTQALITTAVGGALSGAVATGTLKGAVKGGIFAAVTFGIGHGAAGGASPFGDKGRFFAHAAAAGISAEIDGGKFGHGFVASYISIGADKIGLANFQHTSSRIVANAIVAGTISEATGGKFANGAMSAAFRVAFNELQVSARYAEDYQKYYLDGENPIDWDVTFKVKADKLFTYALSTDSGLEISLKKKIDNFEMGVDTTKGSSSGYWKIDSGSKVYFDIPNDEAGIMFRRGFKNMSVAVGMNKNGAFEMSGTVGLKSYGGKYNFTLSGKVNVNPAGFFMQTSWFNIGRNYGGGATEFINRRHCQAAPELCF